MIGRDRTLLQRSLGDTLCDTKVQKVGQFISVRGPVGGFARGEMA
jgi:hypothetical protein